MPGQHGQPTRTSSRVCACSGVTCHLHFWQNDWCLSHANAVTWGLNGYRIRVSKESCLCWRKFFCAPNKDQTHALLITGLAFYRLSSPNPSLLRDDCQTNIKSEGLQWLSKSFHRGLPNKFTNKQYLIGGDGFFLRYEHCGGRFDASFIPAWAFPFFFWGGWA